MTETNEIDELDRIDRSIEIDATAEKVWELVSRPGWWINSSSIIANQVVEHRESANGVVDIVRDAQYGDFPIQTVELRAPRYAAFRWLGGGPDEPTQPSTLVEFFLTDRPGGVELRVVESGFSTLSEDRETWLKEREGNVEGWGVELEAARVHFDPTEVVRSIRVAATAERVWAALTEPEELRRWYAFDGAEVDLEPGGRVELGWAEHGRYVGRVVEVDPPRTFSFRLAHVPDVEPEAGNSTLVTFRVTAGEAGTVIMVRESGLADLDPALGGAEFRDQEVAGWESGLALLDGLLGEHTALA